MRKWLLLAGLFLAIGASAEDGPFAGLWQEPMTTTSRNGQMIYTGWYPQGAANLPQEQRNSFPVLRFDCRVARPETADRFPTVPLTVTLYIPRGPDEPSVSIVLSPLYWILGLSGKEFELTEVTATIDQGPPRKAVLRVRRTDYDIRRPDHHLEELPARLMLTRLAYGTGQMELRLAGDPRIPDYLVFNARDASVKAARAMLERCPR